MGQFVADTHFDMHGMNDTGALIEWAIRLHWGSKSIDETHTMGLTAASQLLGDLGTKADFLATFRTWVNAAATGASADAKTNRADFALAAWRAFGKT